MHGAELIEVQTDAVDGLAFCVEAWIASFGHNT